MAITWPPLLCSVASGAQNVHTNFEGSSARAVDTYIWNPTPYARTDSTLPSGGSRAVGVCAPAGRVPSREPAANREPPNTLNPFCSPNRLLIALLLCIGVSPVTGGLYQAVRQA